MKFHTSLVARQTRLSEWTELVRDCPNCLNEWCQLHDITKASLLLETPKSTDQASASFHRHTQHYICGTAENPSFLPYFVMDAVHEDKRVDRV